MNQKSYRLDLTFSILKNLEDLVENEEFQKINFNLSPLVKPQKFTKESFEVILESLNLTVSTTPSYEAVLNDFANWSRVEEIVLDVFAHLQDRDKS